MTNEQYMRQTKDLRMRIENMKIARQISEDKLGLEIQELKQEVRSKDNQVRLLQTHIAKLEEAYYRAKVAPCVVFHSILQTHLIRANFLNLSILQ